MGNNISASLEQGFEEVCTQVETASADTCAAVLQWSSPPLEQDQITRFTTALQSNATLTRLELRDLDTLDAVGMTKLAQAVQTHATLQTLCFTGRLPADWAVWAAVLSTAKSPLRELEFKECALSSDIVQTLKEHVFTNDGKNKFMLQTLRLVDLRIPAMDLAVLVQAITAPNSTSSTCSTLQIGLKPPDMEAYPEALQHVASFLHTNKALRNLHLTGCLIDNGISIVLPNESSSSSSSELKQLSLQGRGVTDDSMNSLAQFISGKDNQLQGLDLSQSHMTGAGLAVLWPAVAQSASLQNLCLADSSGLGDAGIVQGFSANSSARSSSLTELDLCGTNIQAAGLEAVSKAAHGLQRLTLGEAPETGWGEAELVAVVQLLQQNSSLLELDFTHAAILVPEDIKDDGEGGNNDGEGDQDKKPTSFQELVQAVGRHPALQKWSIQCRKTAQVEAILEGLPQLQQHCLTELTLHIEEGPGGVRWTPALGEQMLANLQKSPLQGASHHPCLREINVVGLRGGQEAAWKSVQQKIQQLLASRSDTNATKRPADEEDKGGDDSDANKRPRAT